MASLFTRNPIEAAQFIRALVARGYRKIPSKQYGGEIPENCYRISRRENYIRVVYYEPPGDSKPNKRIPQPVDGAPRGKGKVCTHPGCHRPHHSRGLCANCVHRYYYWTKEEERERNRKRSAANRAKRKAKREEAA